MTDPKANLSVVIRLFRGLALLGLTLGLGLIGSLFLFVRIAPMHRLLSWRIEAGLRTLDFGIPIALALLTITPLAIGYAFRRLRPNTLRRGVILGLLAAAASIGNLVVMAFSPSVREGF